MKKEFILTLICLAFASTEAKPVSSDDALQAATRFWQTFVHGKGSLHLQEWQYSEIYLFTCEQGGYIMLSSDDCARPVIAYSMNGHIDSDNLPIQLAARLDAYCGLIADGIRQQAVANDADAASWQRLRDSTVNKDSDDRIGPLLETHWHQDGSYALFTPQHTPTGCAATAQSQMMRYWRYPAFGCGSETYNCPPYGAQSADFAHTLYDWENMPDQVSDSSPYAEQVAVATLMYHVGVSLHMGYAPNGSAAAGLAGHPGVASIDNSLQDYFHYSRQMRAIFRSDGGWTDQRWEDTLVAELNQLHPVIYCGVAPEGGHGFICDGYERNDGQLFFHFNFGWSGNGDGYYTVDDICPNVSPTGDVGSAYHFNQSNQALLGAVPDYHLHTSDSLLTFTRNGGDRQLLFCSIDTSSAPWNVSTDQPWVSVNTNGVNHVGILTVSTSPNTTGDERQATVTFTQAGKSVSVTVVQTYWAEEDYCPLTVVMESTTAGGWENGAWLGFESPSGYVYASAALAFGAYDSVLVSVPPHNVDIVFHHGGGTDRFINYRVYNQHGEALANVEYAFMNGGTHHVEWPCVPLAVDIPADETKVLYTEVFDLTGRLLLRTNNALSQLHNNTPMPCGVYIVRTVTNTGVSVKKRVKTNQHINASTITH